MNITADMLTTEFGMTGLENDETLVPDWQNFDPQLTYNVYRFYDSFQTGDVVGVVLPQSGYSVSSSPGGLPSNPTEITNDVYGCWGASGAYVIAGPGLYTFLALRNVMGTWQELEAGALAVDVGIFIQRHRGAPPVFNRLPAIVIPTVFPLTPTDPNKPNGPTGGMISDPKQPDPVLQSGKVVIQKWQPNWTPFTAVKDVDAMTTNIMNVFNLPANGMALINAGEVGHGAPNQWTDGSSTFSADKGIQKGAALKNLQALETAMNGTTTQFDIFSCAVAQGNTRTPKTGKRGCNPNHTQTHLAMNSVDAAGDPVEVRAFDVNISEIPAGAFPTQPNGFFFIKNYNLDTGYGDDVRVTCSGNNPVMCNWKLCPIFGLAPLPACIEIKNTCQ
jgi:hypothetical protein